MRELGARFLLYELLIEAEYCLKKVLQQSISFIGFLLRFMLIFAMMPIVLEE